MLMSPGALTIRTRVSDSLPAMAAASISWAARAAKASMYLMPVETPSAKASSQRLVLGMPMMFCL